MNNLKKSQRYLMTRQSELSITALSFYACAILNQWKRETVLNAFQ